MQQHFPDFTLVTQNVDGLHQRAGNTGVIELHGNIGRTKCAAEGTVVENWPTTDEVPPRCPDCGGLLRPDVVWFNEALPEAELAAALDATTRCEVFLAVGTSAAVYPAASLPYGAKRAGAILVEINPLATALTQKVDFVLTGRAGEILPALAYECGIW